MFGLGPGWGSFGSPEGRYARGHHVHVDGQALPNNNNTNNDYYYYY